MIPAQTIKSTALAAFIAAVVSLAFLMPVTLHFGVPDRIAPVAWYFCPETGQFAPRYWHGRSRGDNPEHWQACLDEKGERIEDIHRHRQIVFSIAGFWFCLLFPPLAMLLRPLFMPTERRIKRQARR